MLSKAEGFFLFFFASSESCSIPTSGSPFPDDCRLCRGVIEDEARLVAEVKAEVEAAASDATIIDVSRSLKETFTES